MWTFLWGKVKGLVFNSLKTFNLDKIQSKYRYVFVEKD